MDFKLEWKIMGDDLPNHGDMLLMLTSSGSVKLGHYLTYYNDDVLGYFLSDTGIALGYSEVIGYLVIDAPNVPKELIEKIDVYHRENFKRFHSLSEFSLEK